MTTNNTDAVYYENFIPFFKKDLAEVNSIMDKIYESGYNRIKAVKSFAEQNNVAIRVDELSAYYNACNEIFGIHLNIKLKYSNSERHLRFESLYEYFSALKACISYYNDYLYAEIGKDTIKTKKHSYGLNECIKQQKNGKCIYNATPTNIRIITAVKEMEKICQERVSSL